MTQVKISGRFFVRSAAVGLFSQLCIKDGGMMERGGMANVEGFYADIY